MGFLHIVIQFEKDNKIYSLYKTNIINRELVDECVEYFKNNETMIFEGYKISSSCNPSFKVYSSKYSFEFYRNSDSQIYNDVDFIQCSESFLEVTEKFSLSYFPDFKILIKE